MANKNMSKEGIEGWITYINHVPSRIQNVEVEQINDNKQMKVTFIVNAPRTIFGVPIEKFEKEAESFAKEIIKEKIKTPF